MSYSNFTPNKQLPQWNGSDAPQREDFNRAMQIMDAIGASITLRPPTFATKEELETAYPSGDGIYSHVAEGVIYVWAGEWVATGIDLAGYYTASQIDELLENVSGLPAGGTDGQVPVSDGAEGGTWKDPGDLSVTSIEAATVENISDTEEVKTIVGKLRKWFTSAAAGLFNKDTAADVRVALDVPFIEVGEWNPALGYDGGNLVPPTYTATLQGTYVLIGDVVIATAFVNGSMTISNIGDGHTPAIAGLPFATSGTMLMSLVGYVNLEGLRTLVQNKTSDIGDWLNCQATGTHIRLTFFNATTKWVATTYAFGWAITVIYRK